MFAVQVEDPERGRAIDFIPGSGITVVVVVVNGQVDRGRVRRCARDFIVRTRGTGCRVGIGGLRSIGLLGQTKEPRKAIVPGCDCPGGHRLGLSRLSPWVTVVVASYYLLCPVIPRQLSQLLLSDQSLDYLEPPTGLLGLRLLVLFPGQEGSIATYSQVNRVIPGAPAGWTAVSSVKWGG